MTQLENLEQAKHLILLVNNLLDIYNTNLRNELFELEENESSQHALQRGETIFDQYDDDVRNITEILNQEHQILEFFNICKRNRHQLVKEKNELISKLLRIIKSDSSISKEQYLNCRDEWNKRREETPDERNRRETEEMLEQIKEEKKELQELYQQLKEQKCADIVREEFNKISSQYVTLNDYSYLVNAVNSIIPQHNLMFQNYVNKEELNQKLQEVIPIQSSMIVKKNELPTDLQTEMKYNLTKSEMETLLKWTTLRCDEVVFDSNIDDWSIGTSVFNEKINERSDLLFLIENEDGQKIGYFLPDRILMEKDLNRHRGRRRLENDRYTFHFNLKSNGRFEEPQKFPAKDNHDIISYEMFDKSDEQLIFIGDLQLYKNEQRHNSRPWYHRGWFQYDVKSKNPFIGIRKYENHEYLIPKRITVIQMTFDCYTYSNPIFHPQ